jgi:hypothetical protein
MTRLEALKDLKAKVEAGTLYDECRMTDGAINGYQAVRVEDRYAEAIGSTVCLGEDVAWVAAYRGSLDAAESLHEAELLGWEYNIDSESGVCVYPDDLEGAQVGFSATPARAWLLAILSALIAQEEQQ